MNNLIKADSFSPLFAVSNNQLTVMPGTIYAGHALDAQVTLPEKLKPGSDYAISVDDARVSGEEINHIPELTFIGGFHVGLDGNIVPQSVWDCMFRPKARDPRGMVLVGDFWTDIYLLNVDPDKHGTSAAGVDIASGTQEVTMPGGSQKPLNWWDAVAVLSAHGKQLLSMAEFSVSALGVEEGKTAGENPIKTGHIPGLRSHSGIEQATGCMWTWGRDFQPSGSWVSVMGGDWLSGSAGPRRFISVDPDDNWIYVGARGRCDHLILG